MDLSAVKSITDPQSLAQGVQSSLDSVTGRHIDLTALQLLADAISGIDIISITVNIIVILIIISLAVVAARMADDMLKDCLPRVAGKVDVKMDETLQLMIRRLVSAAIYSIGLMLAILQIPQLHSLAAALLAGAGIASLAIGFAAKDSLSNLTSGVFLAIFQPFRVGDFVDFKGDFGQVEDLTLRHTVIRTWDSRRLIVPNSVMSTEPIINWSIREPEIIWTVDFDIKQVSDIDRARDIIIREARSHPNVLKDQEIKVQLTGSKHSEQNLKLYFHVNGRDTASDTGCDIRESVRKEFEKEGITAASGG
ncbi:Small-conductance mechanosensitive channel MscMJ [uncultured archaeon]|nr:Small-conductance mechanosensitive channel MscMJ [uncultured archaeon]